MTQNEIYNQSYLSRLRREDPDEYNRVKNELRHKYTEKKKREQAEKLARIPDLLSEDSDLLRIGMEHLIFARLREIKCVSWIKKSKILGEVWGDWINEPPVIRDEYVIDPDVMIWICDWKRAHSADFQRVWNEYRVQS